MVLVGLANHKSQANSSHMRPSTATLSPRMNPKRSVKALRHFKLATYNVRTLCKDGKIDQGKLFQLERGCNENEIDIVVLQEHRFQTEGNDEIVKTEKGILVLSSASKRSAGGVGIYLRDRLHKLLKSYTRVSDRILLAYLDTNPQIVLAAIYAPTECAPDTDKDDFYEDLNAALESIEPLCMTIIAGDFNARVGLDSHDTCPSSVGRHLYHSETNDNGTRLTSLCQSSSLKLAQSNFEQRPGRLWTWTHPGGNHRAQLDHILVNSKWINSVRNCRAYSTVNVQSDHRILCCSLRTSMRTIAKARSEPIPLWHALSDEQKRSQFQLELSNRFAPLSDDTLELQDQYDHFTEAVSKAAAASLGTVKKGKERRHWVSLDTCKIIDQRDEAKIKYEATHKKNPARSARKAEWDRLAKAADSALADDEMRHLETELQTMQAAAYSGNPRMAWDLIRKLSGRQRKPQVKVKSKLKPNASEDELLEEWRLYFEGLLNGQVNPDTLNDLPPPDAHEKSEQTAAAITITSITREEVMQAVNQLKNNKTPGSDQSITAAALKQGGDAIIDQALFFCKAVYAGATPPRQWTTNKIVPIPKKGSRTEMNNYRGISLMSTMAKVYNRVLLNRIRPAIDRILRPNQAGFRPGRSTINQIHALRRILEAADDQQLELIVTFVDFKKAFDSINRSVMFAILRFYGIPAQVVDAIASMYTGSKGAVFVGGKLSEPFDITTGVLQGDVLAPFLFVIVMDYVLTKSERDFGFIHQPRIGSLSRGTPALKICDLDFADDVGLLENNFEHANQQLAVLDLESLGVGLEINVDKTKYMVLNPQAKESGQQLLLKGKPIERVDNFKYLGANMKSSAFDLACRKGQAWSAFWRLEHVWRAKHINLQLKLNIYKTAILSVLLYGGETWAMTKQMELELDGFGTNCLRIILGIKRIDRVRNELIYEQTHMRPLTRILRERQLRYLGHVLRRDDCETAKQFALYDPGHGHRKQGRPRQSYTGYVASLISNEPKMWTREHITELAQNRILWRNKVAGAGTS